ncbi:Nucleic-acid-binding protein from transposon X-element [Eumeta japonica]|uniref:Nucleic-acid-binding protein from transposon X-element n=1 Tax=Eumeta variegata TaxID=151549 RepID=A0A4C1XAV9_EUMVA|nr:Nucleic-acid-binding protein from transposon X-element [Eumeta japonica]
MGGTGKSNTSANQNQQAWACLKSCTTRPKGSHPTERQSCGSAKLMKWRNTKLIYPRRVPLIVENPSLNAVLRTELRLPSDSGGKFRSNNHNNNTTLTQQIFHRGLFTNRPRSNSYSGPCLPTEAPASNAEIIELDSTEHTDKSETQGWQEVNGRKRLRNSPETMPRRQKQTKLNYWLAAPVPTSNSFAELETTDQPKTTDQVTHQATKSPESYSTIYKELKNRSTEFFTYQPKQERSFRVVLKRIHPSTSTDDIKQALEDLHHKPNNIWNVKNTKTRKPLPIFFIDLQPNPNNKHVYSIKSLLNCRVEIEPPKPKREIPQCSNCQQYGHTQKFCHRQSRCVKCAESHHTKTVLGKNVLTK